MNKILKFIIFSAVLIFVAIFIYPISQRSSENGINQDIEVFTSTIKLPVSSPFGRSPVGGQKIATTTENMTPLNTVKIAKPPTKPISNIALSIVVSAVREVSTKSFEELINGSVIQLYCGYFNSENTTFSDIARGTGIIINSEGEILTNRHIIFDENAGKIKSDCFILKSPFPNAQSQKPKIYYTADIINYPTIEKFSGSFSEDKYYNDFAVLKIGSKPDTEKINLILGLDYANQEDYSVLENNGLSAQAGAFNYLPIDWNYWPKDGDLLITLGYGVDASHLANQITSTIGKLFGNINAIGSSQPQILLIASNATTGFSGGALINPQSKGLVGLISWVTSGDEAGKYTVAIFRDFLKTQILQDLNFELK